MKVKLFLILLLSIISYCIHISPVYAADFAVDYQVDYSVGEDGVTTVDYHIHLENLSSTVYASDYTLSTGHKNIADVKAFNTQNIALPTKITQQSNSSNITITLINPSKGYGNAYDWIVEYKTKEVAYHKGNLWNIVVPGFIRENVLRNISIDLTVPSNFGPINYISTVNNPSVTSANNQTTYHFTQDQFTNTGILITLGEYQNYSFKYSYELSNPSYSQNQTYSIAIPSDLQNQNIYYSPFKIQPSSTQKDTDGNYIVSYNLDPKQNENVSIEGIANVLSSSVDFSKPRLPVPLNQDQLKMYTSPQKYWEVDNPQILQLSQKLTSGQNGIINKEKAIYSYVVQNLHYDDKQLYIKDRQRMGALKTLSNKDKVICQEYVDLFVALSRASGVPTRMVAGYAQPAVASIQTLPPNTLHAWAEFYVDSYGWISVDPTWESTSGGLNYFGNIGSDHFPLAIYGKSSVTPELVLAFVPSQDPNKSMVIDTTTDNPKDNINFVVQNTKQEPNLSGFSGNLNFQVKNTGNRAEFINSVNLKTNSNLKLASAQFDKSAPIFPGYQYTVGVPYTSSDYFYNGTKQVNVVVNVSSGSLVQSQKAEIPVLFSPLAIFQYIPYIVTFIIFMLSLGLVNGVIRVYTHSANKK